MKKNNAAWINGMMLLVLFLVFGLYGCQGLKNQEHPQITKGRALYKKYCTECHGIDAKGSPAFSGQYKTIDLTQINKRRDVDEFPVMEIARYIDGRQHFRDTGPRPMPMWGVDMMNMEHQYNPDTARTNMGALISYLITLQEKQ